MSIFRTITPLAGLVLEILLISRLLRGGYKQFPFLFCYVLSEFFTTVAVSASFSNRALRAQYARTYWISDVVQDILIFCLVVSLIQRLVRDRSRLRWLVAFVSLGIAGFSYYRTPLGHLGSWMTELGRDLSFCAAVLNLILWMALIHHRPDDDRLLLISGGLGLQTAGKAIGHSLRQISKPMVMPGNLLIVFSGLFRLFVWWYAFRRLRTAPASPNPGDG